DEPARALPCPVLSALMCGSADGRARPDRGAHPVRFDRPSRRPPARADLGRRRPGGREPREELGPGLPGMWARGRSPRSRLGPGGREDLRDARLSDDWQRTRAAGRGSRGRRFARATESHTMLRTIIRSLYALVGAGFLLGGSAVLLLGTGLLPGPMKDAI